MMVSHHTPRRTGKPLASTGTRHNVTSIDVARLRD